ncbi:MAG: CDP-alcohol phosphatidyltransferase family protein [Bacteroidales bacterium]|nr:CDP-alcohol phosphatidyltransferase family protein [Bacteroidales bacterium]MDY4174002.1 CDP-alcohol phosphatidyltransferase family protein [Bacteroidales bacterium]
MAFSVKPYIPNTITSLNLLCGVIATLCAFEGHFQLAAVFIISGAVFDFFDGFAARALGVSGPMGKELDSLADNISFGLAPAAIYSTYMRLLLTGSLTTPLEKMEGWQVALVAAPLLLAVFAGLRLAKFNIDTRQTESFLGLTTTATGLFTASLFWMLPEHTNYFCQILTPATTLILVAIFCALLVSEIPMFSLKVKHFTWAGNELRVALLVVAVVSIIFLGLGGISLTILLYTLFSILKALLSPKGAKK